MTVSNLSAIVVGVVLGIVTHRAFNRYVRDPFEAWLRRKFFKS